jgi:ubiquinone/menaquinone biosynthesis C-methylase UbiE
VTDCWADWIRTRRTGGDADYEARVLEELAAKRERILDCGGLQPGETLLDVGCGNGLIAFGAIGRGAGEVVFADISAPLLDDCRALAEEAGVIEHCRFVETPAEDLSPIEDASVDVVTTRSVLIYVKDKARAFGEFHRVLRPGGRIALFEPINRFGAKERRRTWGYDVDPALFEKLNALFDEIQPATDPMLDFDERDLVALAESAGFFPVRLTYESEIRPLEPRDWSAFLHSSWNPKVPTVAEAMDQALTAEERELLVAALRPAVEEGRGVWRMGSAYLSGVKPA